MSLWNQVSAAASWWDNAVWKVEEERDEWINDDFIWNVKQTTLHHSKDMMHKNTLFLLEYSTTEKIENNIVTTTAVWVILPAVFIIQKTLCIIYCKLAIHL